MDAEELSELLVIGLAVVGLGLMLFGLGAISAWYWAVKSLRIRPPGWITAVTAAAGLSFAAAQFLAGEWLSGVLTASLFVTFVGSQLQIGPFRGSGG